MVAQRYGGRKEGSALTHGAPSLLSAGADASIFMWDLDFAPPAAGKELVLKSTASVPR